MNREEFINWREKNKENIRLFIVLVTVFFLVLNVYNLQKYTKEISSPEFALDTYIPSEFKEVNLSYTLDIQNNYMATGKNNIIDIEYNPISKSIWCLLEISFLLFILSLLWKSQE